MFHGKIILNITHTTNDVITFFYWNVTWKILEVDLHKEILDFITGKNIINDLIATLKYSCRIIS